MEGSEQARRTSMKVLPYIAIFTFVAGLSLLVAGFAFQDSGSKASAPEPTPFDVRSTTPPDTPTPLPTDVPTATPTPLPFDGPLARMIAPSVGIDHAIEEIGITNNQLDTPKDAVGGVGWYYIYDKPGFGTNSLFAAHVNYNFKNGPFARLSQVKPGDQISIVMGEGGPTYTYEVFFFKRYDKYNIPMGELIDAPTRPANEEWITLITCGGRFQETQPNGLGDYLDRDVVIAKRVIN